MNILKVQQSNAFYSTQLDWNFDVSTKLVLENYSIRLVALHLKD